MVAMIRRLRATVAAYATLAAAYALEPILALGPFSALLLDPVFVPLTVALIVAILLVRLASAALRRVLRSMTARER